MLLVVLFSPVAHALTYKHPTDIDDISEGFNWNFGSGINEFIVLNWWGSQLAVFAANPTDQELNYKKFRGSGPGIGTAEFAYNYENKERIPLINQYNAAKPNTIFTAFATSNANPSYGFGTYANGSIHPGDVVIANTIGNPFMHMVAFGQSATLGYRWNNNHITRVGLFNGYLPYDNITFGLINQYPYLNGVNIEHTYEWSHGYITANIGLVNEHNMLYGIYTSGSTSLGDWSKTVFTGMSAGLRLTPNIEAFGGFNWGSTWTSPESGSLVNSIKGITSGNAYIGVTANGIFTELDRIGLVVSLPWRILSGTADINVPEIGDTPGMISVNREKFNLKSNLIEINAQAFYKIPLSNNQSVKLGIGHRFNASDENTKHHNETIIMFRYNLQF